MEQEEKSRLGYKYIAPPASNVHRRTIKHFISLFLFFAFCLSFLFYVTESDPPLKSSVLYVFWCQVTRDTVVVSEHILTYQSCIYSITFLYSLLILFHTCLSIYRMMSVICTCHIGYMTIVIAILCKKKITNFEIMQMYSHWNLDHLNWVPCMRCDSYRDYTYNSSKYMFDIRECIRSNFQIGTIDYFYAI